MGGEDPPGNGLFIPVQPACSFAGNRRFGGKSDEIRKAAPGINALACSMSGLESDVWVVNTGEFLRDGFHSRRLVSRIAVAGRQWDDSRQDRSLPAGGKGRDGPQTPEDLEWNGHAARQGCGTRRAALKGEPYSAP